VRESGPDVIILQVKNDETKHGYRRLMSVGGKALDAASAAKIYGGKNGCAEEVIVKAARQGRVVAVQDENGRWQFPVWQFCEGGKILPGIHEIVRNLRKRESCDDISVVAFFVNPSSALDGQVPYEYLREKGLKAVRTVKKLVEANAE
jgi:hypothetical protein